MNTNMEHENANVKKKRTYDATRRAEQARRNGARVVEVAERCFLRDGYAGTTITAIAGDAGVSPDTIYKSFGGKAGRVRAILEHALQGAGPVSAEQRSDLLPAAQPDPRNLIRAWGRLTPEVAPRAAPILLLIPAAGAAHP